MGAAFTGDNCLLSRNPLTSSKLAKSSKMKLFLLTGLLKEEIMLVHKTEQNCSATTEVWLGVDG